MYRCESVFHISLARESIKTQVMHSTGLVQSVYVKQKACPPSPAITKSCNYCSEVVLSLRKSNIIAMPPSLDSQDAVLCIAAECSLHCLRLGYRIINSLSSQFKLN